MSSPLSALDPNALEDERLVHDCLRNKEEAWNRLIDKYRRLVFSIPLRLGFSRDDAEEIFQSVWTTIVDELPTLREPRAFLAWLRRTTINRCHRWRTARDRLITADLDENRFEADGGAIPEKVLRELEQDQSLRDAVEQLPPRCAELIRLLFYDDSAVPYEEVAERLQLKMGSIGATRKRCLEKLRRSLEQRGWR